MRYHRVKLSGQPAVYHCITRTFGNQVLLGRREKDKACEYIEHCAEYWNADVLTYCVMGNHVQLLVRTLPPITLTDDELYERVTRCYGEDSMHGAALRAERRRGDGSFSKRTRQSLHHRICDLSSMMSSLNLRIAHWVRHTTGQTLDESKSFWATRFKSILISNTPSDIFDVAAYIDTLPIRAGFVGNTGEYPWSGFGRATSGNQTARQGLLRIGRGTTWKKVQSQYLQRISPKRAKKS